jgi:hypothetical protein
VAASIIAATQHGPQVSEFVLCMSIEKFSEQGEVKGANQDAGVRREE